MSTTVQRSADIAETVRQAVRRARSGDPSMSIADAVALVPARDIGVFLHSTFDTVSERTLLTIALGASPGAAVGEVVLTAQDAITAAEEGRAVILVRPETTPEDVLGMQSARGIITMRGGLASHAAVVARGWGIPAVVGAAAITVEADGIHLGDQVIPAGTVIAIDGRSGEVFRGGADTVTADAPEELEALLDWADRIRAGANTPCAVRVNADTAADAAKGRRLGAEGIGLCRTEHMFLAPDRLPLVRRFILADDQVEEQAALAELEAAQQHDFEGILLAMNGAPITIRLLDPPLHEFLPDLAGLIAAEAAGELDHEGDLQLAAVRRLHEVNPMIGTRGFRLGLVRPGLYQMQVRALCRAIEAVAATVRVPQVEVMIPLVVDAAEMALARTWVEEAVTASDPKSQWVQALKVGAMIETPRAALLADELAEVSDFFSFGTNDLTQLMFAFSRDDVSSKLLPHYLSAGLLTADPFETIDDKGVVRMIREACERSRKARPDIKIGVCGEHAGDPASAKPLVLCGIDYVSCSPYRVPIMRLAVAQALLETDQVSAVVLAAIAADQSEAPLVTDTEPAPTVFGAMAADHSMGGLDEEMEFGVLHALRIKGFATATAVAETAGMALTDVQRVLATLAEGGLAREIQARSLWQLSPAGEERHGALLPVVSADARSGLRTEYEEFVVLNLSFKDLCANWQMRGAEVNDHSDARYDATRIDDLRQLHKRAEPILAGFAMALPRFDSYRQRLTTVLARIEVGETSLFTGVLCGSYHDVWMELHEDLIRLLGVDRHAEGSY